MKEKLRNFEISLKNYLIDRLSDSYLTKEILERRYNNLRIFMDIEYCGIPHFSVSIGMSQASFTLKDLHVFNGSLGQDDALVIKWAKKSNIRGELIKQWTLTYNLPAKDFDGDTILGTGVNKKAKTFKTIIEENQEHTKDDKNI